MAKTPTGDSTISVALTIAARNSSAKEKSAKHLDPQCREKIFYELGKVLEAHCLWENPYSLITDFVSDKFDCKVSTIKQYLLCVFLFALVVLPVHIILVLGFGISAHSFSLLWLLPVWVLYLFFQPLARKHLAKSVMIAVAVFTAKKRQVCHPEDKQSLELLAEEIYLKVSRALINDALFDANGTLLMCHCSQIKLEITRLIILGQAQCSWWNKLYISFSPQHCLPFRVITASNRWGIKF